MSLSVKNGSSELGSTVVWSTEHPPGIPPDTWLRGPTINPTNTVGFFVPIWSRSDLLCYNSNHMQSTIRFFGGAGSVTGSNFMLDTTQVGRQAGGKKFLIDCGLFQGEHAFDQSNWEPFAYDPKEISLLINTHAHIDHIGRIPKLVKDGYTGKILSTEATKALAEPMLYDALELNRHDAAKHGKEPLYDEKDIAQALSQWETSSYHQPQDIGDGVTLELLNSGHILGSAMAKFTREGRSIVFTGDLGGGNSPLLALAEEPNSNYLVMESVYGDKKRSDDSHRREQLEKIIEDSFAKKGTLLIPAFSTERTQDLIFEIRALMAEKRIPSIPVLIDSPLAEKITAAYTHYPTYFSEEIQKRVDEGEKIFSFPELHYVETASESNTIYAPGQTKIILAGSGMSNGGRVVGLEKKLLQDPNSTLLIVGYQAAGSLGRRLVEGATKVFIQGEEVHVRAKVESLYGYSAHMDGEQLLDFVNKSNDTLEEVFVVMGEPAAAGFLVQRIRDYLGIKSSSPEVGEERQIQL